VVAKAFLALEDGRVFPGTGFGVPGVSVAEVVFNTAMSGYQEMLTDPSYCEQIVTLTYPHIGNVGCNEHDSESNKIWAAGLVIRELSPITSNWRSALSLDEFLRQEGVVGITDLDTRQLTICLRDHGALRGCIVTDNSMDEKQAIAKAKACPSLSGQDLAIKVTTKQAYDWTQGHFDLNSNTPSTAETTRQHVVVLDFGVKKAILNHLVDRQSKVTVLPAKSSVDEVLALKPDGVLLSNGPGDPAPCDYAIQTIKQLLEQPHLPIFGICLGYQLLALACGANTIKMKFGHHGANHPVEDIQQNRVMITSQNHGFAVDANTLPHDLVVTHRSLFDGTLQGFKHSTKPVFGFQGHPEASPGPHDLVPLFDQFVQMMVENKLNTVC